MDNPYRRLPPLGTLIGFEAAARLGSFSSAADELGMTQSAISHQIRTLEGHLGQPLFLRINRRVELTDAGVDLHKTAEEALEMIRHGVHRLGAFSKPRSVIVHMRPDMGTYWYLPRLANFKAHHPLIDPWLHTAESEVDLFEAEVHMTITQFPQHGDGLRRQKLLCDTVVPMAAPEMAEAYSGRLRDAPLLHDETAQDWQKWCNQAGIEREDYLLGPNFSDSGMMLEAAARGLGVCLGRRVLASTLIAEGRLVEMSDTALEDDRPTWIVTLDQHLNHADVRAVWDWLVAEASEVF